MNPEPGPSHPVEVNDIGPFCTLLPQNHWSELGGLSISAFAVVCVQWHGDEHEFEHKRSLHHSGPSALHLFGKP